MKAYKLKNIKILLKKRNKLVVINELQNKKNMKHLTIEFDTLGHASIKEKINTESMASDSKRVNRSIFSSVDDHFVKSIGKIKMGQKNELTQLTNGDFIYEKDLKEILFECLKNESHDKKVLDTNTNQNVKIDIIVDFLLKQLNNVSKLKLEEGSRNIKNSRKIWIKGKNEENYQSKGLVFLGKDDSKFLNGEYISVKDLEMCLKDHYKWQKEYEIEKEKEQDKPLKDKEKNMETKRIHNQIYLGNYDLEEKLKYDIGNIKWSNKYRSFVKQSESKIQIISWEKKKNKRKTYNLAPIFIASAMSAFLGIRVETPKTNTGETKEEITNLEYKFHTYKEDSIYETKEEVINRILSKYEIGSKIDLEKEIKIYDSSDYKYMENQKSGTLDIDSTCEIEKISILDQGEIVNTFKEEGINAYQILNLVDKKENIDVVLHLKELGWIDVKDLLNDNVLEPKIMGKEIVLKNEYKGIEKNFLNEVSFETEDGLAKLNVLNSNGKLVSVGSALKDQFGNTYEVEKLQEIKETITNSYEEKKSGKINWNINYISKKYAYLTLLSALLSTALLNRKKGLKKRLK